MYLRPHLVHCRVAIGLVIISFVCCRNICARTFPIPSYIWWDRNRWLLVGRTLVTERFVWVKGQVSKVLPNIQWLYLFLHLPSLNVGHYRAGIVTWHLRLLFFLLLWLKLTIAEWNYAAMICRCTLHTVRRETRRETRLLSAAIEWQVTILFWQF